MPRLSTRLVSTERACETARAQGPRSEYRIAGLRGLVLRVSCRGTKSWSYLYRSPITASWRKVSLGNHPTISLQRAKELARDCMARVRMGSDPLADHPAIELTFLRLSHQYLEAHKGTHSRSWSDEVNQVLARDVLPAIGNHRVAAVKRHEVAQIVERVVGRGSPASANSCLKVVRTIYRWGISTGRCEVDVTMGLKKLPSRPRERILTDHEVRVVWSARTAFQRPYRLSLLTGARIGEVLNADRAEFDLGAALWTIPSWRTKSRREHQLPLSPQALEVVREAMERAGRSRWLFPGLTKTKPLSTKSADAILRQINFKAGISSRFTPHDLRRTCSTRLGNLGVADEIIERILNHAPGSVTRRHYNHSARFPEVKLALDAWAVEVQRIVS